jgi:hypothetical protein
LGYAAAVEQKAAHAHDYEDEDEYEDVHAHDYEHGLAAADVPVLVDVHVVVRARVLVNVLVLVLVLGTTACTTTPAVPAPSPTPSSSSSTATAATAAPAPGATPTALNVELRAEPSAAGFAPVLLQRDGTPSQLAGALSLERRDAADHWQPVAGIDLSLRLDCATPVAPCLELVPGAELHPPAWPARLGAAQCGCPKCAPAPAGAYRFVVHACSGSARSESPAFQVR